MAIGECVLCTTASAKIEAGPNGWISGDLAKVLQTIDCPRCGKYTVTIKLREDLQGPVAAGDQALLPYASAHTRQAWHHRRDVVALTTDNWREFAEAHRHTALPQKLEMLLQYLGALSDPPGAKVNIGPDDFPLFDARDQGEVSYLTKCLVGQRSIESGGATQTSSLYVVTPEGWLRLQPSYPGGKAGTCFVAMWLAPSMKPAYENGFVPAIMLANGQMRPLRNV